MAKFRAVAVETGMWHNCNHDNIVIDTDKVLVAIESDNFTHPCIGFGDEDYIVIDMKFEVYSAIACEGFENTDLVTKLAT